MRYRDVLMSCDRAHLRESIAGATVVPNQRRCRLRRDDEGLPAAADKRRDFDYFQTWGIAAKQLFINILGGDK